MLNQNSRFILNSYITENEKKRLNESIFLYLKELGCERACGELEKDEKFATDSQSLGKYKFRLVQKWKCLLEYQRRIRFLEEENFNLQHQLKTRDHESEGESDSDPDDSNQTNSNDSRELNKNKTIVKVGTFMPLTPYRNILKHSVDRAQRILCFSIHPKTTTIIYGTMDNKILIRDYFSGKSLKILTEHSYPIRAIAFSNSGKKFASSCDGDNIFVWDFIHLKRIASMRGHTFRITSLKWKFDDSLLFSASEDESIRVWDGGVHKHVFTFFQKSSKFSDSGFGKITSMDVSHDVGDGGTYMVAGSTDCFARLFHVKSRRLIHNVKHKAPVTFVKFSNQMVNDNVKSNYNVTMSMLDVNTHSLFVLSGSRRDNDVWFWDRRNGEIIAKFNNPKSSHPVDGFFHPDGEKVVIIYSNFQILFFDISKAECVRKMKITQTTNVGEIIGMTMSMTNKSLIQSDIYCTRVWKLN